MKTSFITLEPGNDTNTMQIPVTVTATRNGSNGFFRRGDIGAIGLLNFVCLLMRNMTSFLRYTGYLIFINDPISHVLLLFQVHALLLSFT